MKTSTKASLLSALVFPGAGQLYLKRHGMAAVLLLMTLTAIGFLIVPLFAIADDIAGRLVGGDLQPGPELLADIVAETQQAVAAQSLSTPGLALLGLWVVGVAHAWRVGRQHDHEASRRPD